MSAQEQLLRSNMKSIFSRKNYGHAQAVEQEILQELSPRGKIETEAAKSN